MKTLVFLIVLLISTPGFAKTEGYEYFKILRCKFSLTDGKSSEHHRIVIYVQDLRGGRAMVQMRNSLYPSSLTYVQTLQRSQNTPISFDLNIGGTGNDHWQSELFFELSPVKKSKKGPIRKGQLTLKTSDGLELKSTDVLCHQV